MSRTVESALGDVVVPTIPPGGWGAALAAAVAAHLVFAAGYAAWERARAALDPVEKEVAIDVRLGPPGGRLEPEPVAAPPSSLPPDKVAEPSRTERASDSPPITPTAPPPPVTPGAVLSSGIGSGGDGGEVAPPPPPPPAPEPPPRPEVDPAILKRYANRAAALISERLVYPASALRNQMEGRAVLRLTINRRGRLLASRMVEGTGHEPLDEAIMRAVRDVPNYGPLPEGYPEEQLTFGASIRFVLVEAGNVG